MINYEERMYLINLKLEFWRERLKESNNSIVPLYAQGDQSKIDGNLLDINNYTSIISELEKEKSSLTNQG